jgi:2-dehydro-3-deoxygluconokinase
MAAGDIICFGECMLELSRTSLAGSSWNLGVAGDTYNVAVYLRRLGLGAEYMTALGNEEFSQDIKDAWAVEEIGDSWCLTNTELLPGLYAIRVDQGGERTFSYWRAQSAARSFFECRGAELLLKRAENAQLLYLSGITLSLFGETGRARIRHLADAVRKNGGKVAFDSNYRPRGWPDKAVARRVIEEFGRHVDIALPTLEDDQELFGDSDGPSCAARWRRLGVSEVAVKLGAKGAYVASEEGEGTVDAVSVVNVRDTTGAGDSFNAGYIAARLNGHSPLQAAETGCRLAASVVQHPGAIIRKMLMPVAPLRSTAS